MGHAATVALSKAKLLQLDHRQKNPRSENTDRGYLLPLRTTRRA